MLTETFVTFSALEVFLLFVNFLMNPNILCPRKGFIAESAEESFFLVNCLMSLEIVERLKFLETGCTSEAFLRCTVDSVLMVIQMLVSQKAKIY